MNKKQQELYEKLLKKVNEYCLGAAAEDVIEAIDNLVDDYENTGETPYQVLNAIKEQMPKYDEVGTVEVSKADIRTIENALKALKIIDDKRVYVRWLKSSPNLYRYNMAVVPNDALKEREYKLLKEIYDESTH